MSVNQHELGLKYTDDEFIRRVMVIARAKSKGTSIDADDLTQTVLHAFLKSRNELKHHNNILAWCNLVCANKVIDLIRSHSYSRTKPFSSIEGIEEHKSLSQSDTQTQSIQLQQIEDFINTDKFNENERMTIIMRSEGMSYAEIAEALDIPEGNVGKTYSRARKKLSEWDSVN